MKGIIAFLLFVILPMNLLAFDDACTKPALFKTDKRCYVTDAQKKTKPYNAVVALIHKGNINCTGTFVKTDETIHLYTAKHCTDNNDDNISDKDLEIRTQTGTQYLVFKKSVGNYNEKSTENSGDWAIYDIYDQNVPFVKISNLFQIGLILEKETEQDKKQITISDKYDARLIGYGALKIMSDEDIKNFKNKYINYLKNNMNVKTVKGTESAYGFDKSGGIYRDDSFVKEFIDHLFFNDRKYYDETFNDKKLKVSYCEYSSIGAKKGCQSWYGNSGGGIFDKYGNIMAINTRGSHYIGGNEHAGKEKNIDKSTQINLLSTPTEKIKSVFTKDNKLDTLPKGR